MSASREPMRFPDNEEWRSYSSAKQCRVAAALVREAAERRAPEALPGLTLNQTIAARYQRDARAAYRRDMAYVRGLPEDR